MRDDRAQKVYTINNLGEESEQQSFKITPRNRKRKNHAKQVLEIKVISK